MTPHEDLVWLVEMRGMLRTISDWAEREGDTTLIQVIRPPLGIIENRIALNVIGDELRALRDRRGKR